MDQPIYNAADEDTVRQRKRGEKDKRAREIADLRAILATEEGRRFVWGLLGFCRVFATSMTGNSQTFFNEGMRNVGLKLLRDISEAKPDALLDLQREAADILNGGTA